MSPRPRRHPPARPDPHTSAVVRVGSAATAAGSTSGCPDGDVPLAALTARELDVLREMAQGRTDAGIEEHLRLSSSTVEKHVNAIFTKLQLSDAPVHRRVAAVLAFLTGT